jgi:aminocarboxymuconate-semialdehyde decarboxylase
LIRFCRTRNTRESKSEWTRLIFSPEALRHLAAQVGISQIMLGSDHPYPWQDHPVDHIMATTSLSDDDKLAILGGNAAKVFGMKV